MGTDRIITLWNQIYSDKGEECCVTGTMPAFEAALLYGIVQAEAPKNILEIGAGFGFSTIHIAESLKHLGGTGHLFTVDSDLIHGSKCITFVKEVITRLGLNDLVTFITDKSPDCISKIVKKKHPIIPHYFEFTLDLVLIDGDHSIEGTTADFKEVIKYMSPNGKIILHDTKIHSGPANLLFQAEKEGYRVMHFNTQCGMAVIQVNTI